MDSTPHPLLSCNLTPSYSFFKIISSLPECLCKAGSGPSLMCSLVGCFYTRYHSDYSCLTPWLGSEHLWARVCPVAFFIPSTELGTYWLINVQWMNGWMKEQMPCLLSEGPSEYHMSWGMWVPALYYLIIWFDLTIHLCGCDYTLWESQPPSWGIASKENFAVPNSGSGWEDFQEDASSPAPQEAVKEAWLQWLTEFPGSGYTPSVG